MSEKLVVIGGTAAGLSAASKAKREGDFEATIIEKTGYTSYGACGLPYFVGGTIEDASALVTLTPQELRDKRNMQVHLHCEALSIDRGEKRIEVQNLQTQCRFSVPYDKLVIATGAAPIFPNLPGIHLKGVFGLRSVEDGVQLRQQTAQGDVCIVGGGYIGLELASELAASGRSVTIIERLPHVLPTVNEDFAAIIESELRESGVTLHTGTELMEIEGQNGSVCAAITTKGRVPCATLIMCIGVRPNIQLAQNCGLAIGSTGAIQVNSSFRTSDDSIWACGDCIETYHVVTGRPVYMPLGTHANKQGKCAGAAIAGKSVKNPGVAGSQIAKIASLYVGGTGLSEREAQAAGFSPVVVTIKKNDCASYYPGGKECRVRLVGDQQTKAVLGGQAIGGASIAGRINVIAAAVSAKMSVAELAALDMVYAPPVAPVYDPIIIAAEQLVKEIERREP